MTKSTPWRDQSPNFGRGIVLGNLVVAPVVAILALLWGFWLFGCLVCLIATFAAFMWWHG